MRELGSKPLRKSSHGFELFGAIPIIDAAVKQVERFRSDKAYRNAAISLMNVVLAANRAYNKQVEPHVRRMRETWPNMTLVELQAMIAEHDFVQFSNIWGHVDEKKFEILRELVNAALDLPTQPGWSDYDRLHAWAGRAALEHRLEDPLGSVRYVGIATFQHLRISFGIDTVKPDQRVTEVLENEFGARLTPEQTVIAVEQIAGMAGMRVIEIDQIFVKYGSGYYV